MIETFLQERPEVVEAYMREQLLSVGISPDEGDAMSEVRSLTASWVGSVRKIFSGAPPERPLVQLIGWVQPADTSAKALKCDISDAEECGKCVIFRHRASESLDTGAYPVVRLLHYKVSKGVCAIFELECVGDPHANMRMGEPVAEFGSWQAEALAEEKAKLAGGFRVGERVVSLIDHALMGVARGDVGTAVGPCEAMNGWSPSDNAARLSVDFGEGKGRVNLLDKDTVSEAEWPKHRKEDEVKVFTPRALHSVVWRLRARRGQ